MFPFISTPGVAAECVTLNRYPAPRESMLASHSNATTGEILRELVLDPTRDYQPATPRTTHRNDEPTYVSVGPLSRMSCDITLSG